jgi:hypothetical protein
MRILLAGALTAAALFAATPSMGQTFGYDPGYYGGAYDGQQYYNPYNYGPGSDYRYTQPAPPVYEGRSAAVDPGIPDESTSSDVAYCQQRFRSYNPSTGMFLGFDGQYHPCP